MKKYIKRLKIISTAVIASVIDMNDHLPIYQLIAFLNHDIIAGRKLAWK